MCLKSPLTHSQLNIAVPCLERAGLFAYRREFPSLWTYLQLHTVCFHRPWVLRRKKSGVSALLLITSASHTCSGTV